MRRRRVPFALAVALGFGLGCGGAVPEPQEPTSLPRGGGEGPVAVVAPPVVIDLPALVPADADLAILVRADRLRSSEVAPVLEEVLREGAMGELATLGVDPLQDIDRCLIAGREAAQNPDVMAFEHHWDDARVLDLYTRMSHAPAGTVPELHEVGRFRVAAVPSADLALALLTPTLFAVAPADRIDELLERAEAPGTDAGEAGRHLRAADSRAPDLAPVAAVQVSAVSPDSGADWGREMMRLGLPSPTWATVVVAVQDGATAFAEAGYGTDVEAEMAERGVRAMLTQTLHPVTLLLRVMGLARALQSSQIAREGTQVALRTHLQPDELQRVIARLRSAP